MSFVWKQKSWGGGRIQQLSTLLNCSQRFSAKASRDWQWNLRAQGESVQIWIWIPWIFFFFLINANKGVNSLPLPGSLRHIHLENLYILMASTQNTSFPIHAVKWTNASFLQQRSPCIIIASARYDTVSTRGASSTTQPPKKRKALRLSWPLFKIRGILCCALTPYLAEACAVLVT